MEEKPNYYAIIPANVRYDKKLKDKAKLLYGEITALSNKDGKCYASNKYFAELYGITITTVSMLIKNLIDSGYITRQIIYKEGTKEILNRYLKIFKEGIKENLKDNITSINNINIKENIKEKKTYGEFRNVLLTDEEYEKLEKSNLLMYIETLSSYIASKGVKYKSHYATILNWSRKESKSTKPDWFDTEIKKESLTLEEQNEMEELMKEFR